MKIVPNKVLVVDCNAVCYSAYYSMGHLAKKDGRETGVIYGFFSQLQYVCRSQQIAHIVFCWDSRQSLRKKLCPTYKNNRKKEPDSDLVQFGFSQFDELRDNILPGLGFVNSFQKTGFEADDLIASVCRFPVPQEGQQYIILSSDNDLYQLLTPQVSMFKLKDRTLYTKWDFVAEFKIDPTFWSWVKAAAGCSGDNVVGISGIGPVKACQYINDYSGIRHHKVIDSTSSKEIIERNLPLVALPFEGTPKLTLDWETLPSYSAWMELCERLEFESFLRYPDTFENLFSGMVPTDGLDRVILGGRRPKIAQQKE